MAGVGGPEKSLLQPTFFNGETPFSSVQFEGQVGWSGKYLILLMLYHLSLFKFGEIV
jgi:hypothetical protein